MKPYEIPTERRCRNCSARMPNPAMWVCGACGATQTPPSRPGGIRGFLGEVNNLKPVVFFFAFLIVVVVAFFVAGWGQYLVRGPIWAQ